MRASFLIPPFSRLVVTLLGYDPFPAPPGAFADRLKAARIAAGLTRRQLATRLGVHPVTVAEWERGEKRPSKGNREQLEAFMAGGSR